MMVIYIYSMIIINIIIMSIYLQLYLYIYSKNVYKMYKYIFRILSAPGSVCIYM